ncbi:MAG: plastocyanin/azurin family copper-binding protein [Dehalococcoidia bacterium]
MARLLTSLLIMTFFALGLAACGGDDDEDSAEPTAEAEDAGDPEVSGPAVEVADFEFLPVDLEVSVGETVTWTSTGESVHTVTADDETFDSEDLGTGDRFERVFDSPGTYSYICIYHAPQMAGTITVVE